MTDTDQLENKLLALAECIEALTENVKLLVNTNVVNLEKQKRTTLVINDGLNNHADILNSLVNANHNTESRLKMLENMLLTTPHPEAPND